MCYLNFDKPSIDELMHYGTPRHSGRYPWGSGKDPYQHSRDFLTRVESLKDSGMSETQIAKEIGLSTTELRVQKSLALEERRSADVATAKRLRDSGMSLQAVAEQMGFKNDSSVRALLNEDTKARMDETKNTYNFLKEQIDKKGMIDVGVGVERELGISKEKLNQALYMLERDGYPTYNGRLAQATMPGQFTTMRVVGPPGTEHKDIYDASKINSLKEYASTDDGQTFNTFRYPESMDSKRLKVRYAEEGGIDKDGVIELRRGVKDISLGESNYAQVRMLVDGTHYLKGMAVYSDDMPKGVDVIFNTNKPQGTPVLGPKDNSVLKPIKNDENPFGALIKANGQSDYIDSDGKKKMSLINKTKEQGDWNEWSDKLPSQFLAKQNQDLVKRQLDLTKKDRYAEFDEIKSLTNPTLKKHYLSSFAEDCDAAAVHLKAAALPRQKYKVILPVNSLKDNEVYAPDYRNGEKLALVRYPHGGTFEIPILTVNNKNKEGDAMIGKMGKDAIGITKKVADRLSGADFDGDTAMCIPTNSKIKISSTPPLKELEGFDTKLAYPYREGMKVMKDTQKQMGVISNLITDMTLKGASQEELARAVKHSMVVIDAEKHKLDYKRSEADNNIAQLKAKYQGHIDEETGKYREGASTLISRAKSEVRVPKRVGSPVIDKETGEVSYKSIIETYKNPKTGKEEIRTSNSTKMAETKDANSLSSGTWQEKMYADYANSMKSLANQARKEMVNTKSLKYSPEAKKEYSEEYNSLMAKLNVALKNAPKERMAQTIANAGIKNYVNAYKEEYGDSTKVPKKDLKKKSQQLLQDARAQVGASKTKIQITDKEWNAIQAGAVTENVLHKILNNTDADNLRERAMPRENKGLSEAKVNKIQAMQNSGYTIREIADSIGSSTGTVSKYLK